MDALPSVAADGAPNALEWFCLEPSGSANNASTPAPSGCAPLESTLQAAGCTSDASDCMLNITLSAADGSWVRERVQPLTDPKALALPAATLHVEVLPAGDAVLVTAVGGVALWVLLTSTAAGRFDGQFARRRAGASEDRPLRALDPATPRAEKLTAESVRAEHLAEHLAPPAAVPSS
mgnify:CR=1 FL=1|jgi:hypothetical protein